MSFNNVFRIFIVLGLGSLDALALSAQIRRPMQPKINQQAPSTQQTPTST
jgi:hypothetical protein